MGLLKVLKVVRRFTRLRTPGASPRSRPGRYGGVGKQLSVNCRRKASAMPTSSERSHARDADLRQAEGMQHEVPGQR
jgi:hypothetical protein